MTKSKSLGVRVPVELLPLIDSFQEENKLLSRSETIVELIKHGLSERIENMILQKGQDQESGARASKWGHVTSRKIAEVIGAKEISKTSNEFELDGERVTIRCARPRTSSVGLTNAMRERIGGVIAAFQQNEGQFNLLRVSPDDWDKHCRKVTENHQNHGRVTLLSRSICQQIGEDMGEVEIEEN